jgi:hypothetical protein
MAEAGNGANGCEARLASRQSMAEVAERSVGKGEYPPVRLTHPGGGAA